MHKYNTRERCKIPAIECARIIDGLLSSGEIIETQDIYDELEKTYHWVQELHIEVFNNYKACLKSDNAKDKDKKRKDYEYMCSRAYSYSVSKDALPRLRREIRRLGLNPDLILRRVNGEYNKKKKGYQYTKKRFSAFNTDVNYDRKNLKKQRTIKTTIALFTENAASKNPPLGISDAAMDNFIRLTSIHNPHIIPVTSENIKSKLGDEVVITDGDFKDIRGRVARIAEQQKVLVELFDGCLVATAYIPMGIMMIDKNTE